MWSCAVWNTFGPIASSAKKVYGWTDGTISQFTLWGVMDFPLFFLPSAYLLSISLRYSVIVGSSCMFVAAVLRCLPLWFPSIGSFTLFCHFCSFINAIGGPIAMSAPIQISAAWFPPNERTRATSISQMFNALGVGVSYLLGTFIVGEADTGGSSCGDSSMKQNGTSDDIITDLVEIEIETLLYTYAGVAGVIMLLILIYFPSKPPNPPSNTASEDRMDFMAGIKSLLWSRNAWLIMVTYSLSQGLVQMWQSSMVINMTSMEICVSETWVSTLGIVISFSSVAASIVIATFIDYFRKKMKLAITFLLCCSGVIFIFCTLITEEIISFDHVSSFKVVMYILLVTGVSLSCGCAPIAFEFCVELCYPVAEGTIGIWLTVWFNILSAIFFGVFQIPHIGTQWLNYVLPVSVLLPLPALLLVKEDYRRSKLDENI